MDRCLGDPVAWTPVAVPSRPTLRGAHVVVRPVRADDSDALYEASVDPEIWAYLPTGPYDSTEEMRAWAAWAEQSADPMFFTLAPLPDETPQGVASYLRIEPDHGVIEVGHIWFGTGMQRTTAATEAIYMMTKHVFDLGYRRFEWKCNALNEPSRRAAERFGFSFEGVFRNHMVVKGRNRDTAWYAMTAEEWPAVRASFEAWLSPINRDKEGGQKRSLSDFRP